VPEVLYSTNLTDKTQFETADKLPVTIHVKDGEIFVNNAKVMSTDYLTSNGVLHLIDELLLPNSTTTTP
jgi:transforming growth factor-beta-induced protein